jgi:hypothetical protein
MYFHKLNYCITFTFYFHFVLIFHSTFSLSYFHNPLSLLVENKFVSWVNAFTLCHCWGIFNVLDKEWHIDSSTYLPVLCILCKIDQGSCVKHIVYIHRYSVNKHRRMITWCWFCFPTWERNRVVKFIQWQFWCTRCAFLFYLFMSLQWCWGRILWKSEMLWLLKDP